MKMEFRSKGYATEDNAARIITRHGDMAPNSTKFVAVQAGRYFPVVIKTDRENFNMPAMIARGFTVVN